MHCNKPNTWYIFLRLSYTNVGANNVERCSLSLINSYSFVSYNRIYVELHKEYNSAKIKV
jgi:hypothetical protein